MQVLVLNCGSSSIKFALVDAASGRRAFGGMIDALDSARPSRLDWVQAGQTQTEVLALEGHAAALRALTQRLAAHGVRPEAVGHRVVHGGTAFDGPARVDAAVKARIRELAPLAPLHNPANLAGIEAAEVAFPGVTQVAVFDTAFHQTLPEVAYRYAVPEAWLTRFAVRKYGFHGTSVHYVSRRMAEVAPERDRLVVAHLGNGCSVTAVAGGCSVDTTMGLTPLAGLVMGRRSGDVDPGLFAYLGRVAGMEATEVDAALNGEAGLAGLAGESDLRELEAAVVRGETRARLACEIFADRVAKAVASLCVPLGGLDALVFTGGIGEHGAVMRGRILSRLAWLGFAPEAPQSLAEGVELRVPGTPAVYVVRTDEERMIAEACAP